MTRLRGIQLAGTFVSIVLWPALLISPVAAADDNDPFVRSTEGSGQLIEKLIVTKSNIDCKPHKDAKLPKDAPPPQAFSVFWHLKPGPGDKMDGYLLGGDAEGLPYYWLKEDQVEKWRTRFAFEPSLPGKETAFVVYGDNDLKEKEMEFTGIKGAVPTGSKRFALITAPGKDDADEEGAVFPIICFTGDISAGTTVKEQAAAEVQELALDIVFVIDTTSSMDPLVKTAKEAIRQVVAELASGAGQHLKGAISFGLVEYRDIGDDFVSKVTLPLNNDPNKLYSALESVRCEGGGDIPEAVTTGLQMALDKAGWNKNSAKHIILLGDAPNHEGEKQPTIDDITTKANRSLGNAQQTALSATMIHAVASFSGKLEPKVADDFRKLTQGDKKGFYFEMNADSADDQRRIVAELVGGLRDQLTVLEHITAGTYSGGESTTEAGKAMEEGAYRIFHVSGKAGDRSTHTGFARAVDVKGNRVATRKILVTRAELRRLWSGLDNLVTQFRGLKKGRGDIADIVKRLGASVAGTVTGDRLEITDSTTLEEIVGKDLPMKTQALRITIANVAVMENKDFDAFIATLDKARKHAGDLNDNAKLFSRVNESIEGSESAFLEYNDLP